MSTTMDRLPPKAFALICDHLLYSYAEPNTLVTLASTSRAFHEHALNTLWHILPSPGYNILVYTLPVDAWSAREINQPTASRSLWDDSPTLRTALSIVRRLVATDLTRLKHYSHRVKHIERPGRCALRRPSYTAPSFDVDSSVLQALVQILSELSDEILLPNIRTLDLEHPEGDQDILYPHLHTIYGPKLLRLTHHLVGLTPQNAHNILLASLARSSPYLQDLELLAPTPSWGGLSHHIVNFHRLVSIFTLGVSISPEALVHLATLDTLETLRVAIDFGSCEQLIAICRNAEGKGYFSHLVKLDFSHAYNLALPAAILRAISSPALRHISASVQFGKLTSQMIKELVESIALGQRWTSSLQSVEVQAPWLVPGEAVTFDALRPLLSYSALESVTVRAEGRYLFDDNDLNAMAAAWPSLRVLELGPNNADGPPKPRATLLGLVALAKGCPDLCSLTIAFDASLNRIPSARWELRPGLGFEQRTLTTLSVGRTAVDDPIAVAAFLSDVFPALRRIYSDHPVRWVGAPGADIGGIFDTHHGARWEGVADMYLPWFEEVRRQERTWAKERVLNSSYARAED
ncbi:hypothetical protein C2E23DRAFT_829238 [Lenzites betulinus]|nr:hypothetical protein C2E23DRAFT_829238 [Lenzites betulinus]